MRALIARLKTRLRRILLVGMTLIYLIAGTLILVFDTQLEIGDVAREDIFAPESIIYESEVETALARERARQTVEPVYNRVSNAGSERAILTRNIIDYIDLVRSDPPEYATQEQKLEDLQAIEALQNINTEIWLNILNASNGDWNRIAADIIDVLNRAMRMAIPPDGLEEAREQLYTRVDSSFSDDEQAIVVTIVGELLVPNRILDEEATRARQETLVADVPVQLKSFESGEIIVSKGEPIEADDIEAMEQLGLIGQSTTNWRGYASALIMLTIVTVIMLLYAYRFYPETFTEENIIVMALLLLFFLGTAKLFNESFVEVQNLYPGAALALLAAMLIGPHMGAIMGLGLAVLVAMIVDESLEFVTFIAVGGIAGVLTLQDLERLNAYFVAGIVIGMANALVFNAFQLTTNESQATIASVAGNGVIGLLNGLFAAVVAMGLLLLVGAIMNLTTGFKLSELMQPNQPLLRRLLRETPGTYQHSLQVANLAEQATESIGGNSTLVRVAAMYHDIGKMLNPQFFVENQASGLNPHEFLGNPWQSAKIIIDHVIEGDRMARRYRLPSRIRDFIREHHGTNMPVYFYRQALEQVDNDESRLNIEEFTYPGPRPQSRETGILMLADGIESAARARKPHSEQEIVEVVDLIMEGHIQKGQLDESHLTLNDLKVARAVFIETLQGIYHTRISYPEPLKALAEQGKQTGEKKEPAALPERTATQEAPAVTGTSDPAASEKPTKPVLPSLEDKPKQVRSRPIPVKPKESTETTYEGTTDDESVFIDDEPSAVQDKKRSTGSQQTIGATKKKTGEFAASTVPRKKRTSQSMTPVRTTEAASETGEETVPGPEKPAQSEEKAEPLTDSAASDVPENKVESESSDE